MTGKPTGIAELLKLVNQVLEICVQAQARSEALEALLVDKGLVTEAELNAKVQECGERTKKLANSLGLHDFGKSQGN